MGPPPPPVRSIALTREDGVHGPLQHLDGGSLHHPLQVGIGEAIGMLLYKLLRGLDRTHHPPAKRALLREACAGCSSEEIFCACAA